LQGITQGGPATTEDQLSRLAMPRQDQLEPWSDQIYQWITKDRPQMTRIHELLAMRGCQVSDPPLRRFALKGNWCKRSKTTVRMADTPPREPVVWYRPGATCVVSPPGSARATCVVSPPGSARGDVRPTRNRRRQPDRRARTPYCR